MRFLCHIFLLFLFTVVIGGFKINQVIQKKKCGNCTQTETTLPKPTQPGLIPTEPTQTEMQTEPTPTEMQTEPTPTKMPTTQPKTTEMPTTEPKTTEMPTTEQRTTEMPTTEPETEAPFDPRCWYDGEYMENGEYIEVSQESVGVMLRSGVEPRVAERMLQIDSFNGAKCLVIICIESNVTKVITTCRDCPPDPSDTSLSFAFDTTESMHSEAEQMKTGVKNIVHFVDNNPTSNIGLYVLAEFNDPMKPAFGKWNSSHNPGYELVIATNNNSLFESKVDNITIGGGVDCPEMAFGGIQEAGAVSLENSYIYVITDASHKDKDDKYAAVEAMVLHKSLHVVFILTGVCGRRGVDTYYTDLAEISNGLVIEVDKDKISGVVDLTQVFTYIQTTFTANRVCLLNSRKVFNGFNVSLVIDTTLCSFTVIVDGAGSDTGIILTLPNGYISLYSDHDTSHFKNSLMFTVHEPMTGNWMIQVVGDKEYDIGVTANSTFQLEYGFTLDSNNYNICGTYRQPIMYLHNYLLVTVSDASQITTLTEAVVEYYEVDNKTELDLTYTDGVYRSQALKTMHYHFDIKIVGSDYEGNPLVRELCTIFSSCTE